MDKFFGGVIGLTGGHTTHVPKFRIWERGGGEGGGSRTDTAADESRNEMVDRVARYRFV